MVYAAAYPDKFEGEKGSKLMQVISCLLFWENRCNFSYAYEVMPIFLSYCSDRFYRNTMSLVDVKTMQQKFF